MTDNPDTPQGPDMPQEEEKKLYVDENWKSQVEAERKTHEGPPTPDAVAAEEEPLLTASLSLLVTSLATQTMVAMGLIAEPGQEKPVVELDQAKHLIDLLGMLKEKTQGNRTPEEDSLLDGLLHQLRMAYVAVSQSPADTGSP